MKLRRTHEDDLVIRRRRWSTLNMGYRVHTSIGPPRLWGTLENENGIGKTDALLKNIQHLNAHSEEDENENNSDALPNP